jgi:hypothetical protein
MELTAESDIKHHQTNKQTSNPSLILGSLYLFGIFKLFLMCIICVDLFSLRILPWVKWPFGTPCPLLCQAIINRMEIILKIIYNLSSNFF